MSFRLRLWPDPILHQRCTPVPAPSEQDPELDAAIACMLRIVEECDALGLAANQIGYTRRVIVIRYRRGAPWVLINPTIVSRSGIVRGADERCLSVPGVSVRVVRAAVIGVRWETRGQKGFITTNPDLPFEDLEAAIIQHEIDHLDGRTIAEHPAARRHVNNVSALAALSQAAIR